MILSGQGNPRQTTQTYSSVMGVLSMTEQSTGEKRSWGTMELRYVGNVRDVVRMPGMGKSATGADPGDFLKPPGQDH